MRGKFVSPAVYLLSFPQVHMPGLTAYLQDTEQTDFLATWQAAKEAGVSDGEALCSFMAKLCYKSLVLGENANVTRIRDIPDNLHGVLNTAHGSVLEHCNLSFVITNCSRVFTHEQVRHRIAAYSQTSGRYCRLDAIDFVWDDLLDEVRGLAEAAIAADERTVYEMECRYKLRKPNPQYPTAGPLLHLDHIETCFFLDANNLPRPTTDAEWFRLHDELRWVPDTETHNFTKRKQLTSLIRRFAPNGQANEIGMTANIRSLRHYVMMRTAKHAEREIRVIAGAVYRLVKGLMPILFSDAVEGEYDGLLEVTGMKMQPYDLTYETPGLLSYFSTDALQAEIDSRA